MTTRRHMERATDFESFNRIATEGQRTPFLPSSLAHIYVKLDFKHKYENARTSDDARSFLRSVARAATAAHYLAERNGGLLLEVQGSTLHVGLPSRPGATKVIESAMTFVGHLHQAYRAMFDDARRPVDGWRMTVDAGKTLLVAGSGVHDDHSLVSLGPSANRPAKHLYAQLELAEDDRHLKRFCVGVRDPRTGRWDHEALDRLPVNLDEAREIGEQARSLEPRLDFVEAASGWQRVTAQAAPIAPAGAPGSPSADKPVTYFGWVMRTDLDGFTKRVDECFDDAQKVQELAVEFHEIMDAAASFAEQNEQTLAQLPWAGDNFTAAAVFDTKAEYDRQVATRLVELSLDFELEMNEAAVDSGFDGWAHGIAGGEIHGNSGGNIYLAGVEVAGRRFLVGAGEGFGRSTQAFGDINPEGGQIVIYEPDWDRLDESYKAAFKPAVTHRNETSTLYWIAPTDALRLAQVEKASMAKAAVTVTLPRGQTGRVPIKPHYR